ncbi:unnamed protein product [Brassicogethes aeneus]|uniref:Uncharacterized protein n=1 Tax=Brassicogethes aeneus TaxID=1431903 RepID=A0A9P0B7Q5_BRAAE|nr:unnamed protein product [Brassicogethes aeneus]
MSKSPRHTSTPYRSVNPVGRPPIRKPDMPDVVSPIVPEKQVKEQKARKKELRDSFTNHSSNSSHNYDSDSESSGNDYKDCVRTKSLSTLSPKKIHSKPSDDNNNQFSCIYVLIIPLMLIVIGIAAFGYDQSTLHIKLYTNEDFEHDFKNQNKELWYNIEGAVNDIEKLNRISVFMFLYTDHNSKEVLDKIVDKITNYYNCKFKYCSLDRVDIEGQKLAEHFFTEDYGRILTTYKEEMEKKGVFIVRNLEDVPTESAQAFHSICDQYEPLVENSFIILTMKVERLPNEPVSFCEEKLRKQWSTLEDDKFYPLYTRISNVIIGIYPEDS